jgi:UDP-N-acetyl-D-galactosamine dehydrogenase
MNHKNNMIAVIGMGYVGLPLAIALAKKNNVIGFDIDKTRIINLKKGLDKTKEFLRNEILNSKNLKFSDKTSDLSKCEIYIITVPTPVDSKNKPNLKPLVNATKTISKVLSKNNLVIYESTVFPGATEELCGPILEKNSGFKINKNLYLGYSPERINPGDKNRKLTNIVKIVSGSNNKAKVRVSKLYSSIIKAGVYEANSIKTAEAAKVIENTQRDLNIALINELSIIFKKLKLDTEEILKAAETKWNFNSFRPGLVGGHCIGVDPYYLTYKSKIAGHNPKIILAGRKLNDNMSTYVAKNILKIFKKKKIKIKNAKILVMGLSFKENCSDLRNSKILDACKFLLKNNTKIDAYDPLIDKKAIELRFLNIIKYPKKNTYDCIIISAKHNSFLKMKFKKINSFCNKEGFIYDLKYMINKKEDKNYFRI